MDVDGVKNRIQEVKLNVKEKNIHEHQAIFDFGDTFHIAFGNAKPLRDSFGFYALTSRILLFYFHRTLLQL